MLWDRGLALTTTKAPLRALPLFLREAYFLALVNHSLPKLAYVPASAACRAKMRFVQVEELVYVSGVQVASENMLTKKW